MRIQSYSVHTVSPTRRATSPVVAHVFAVSFIVVPPIAYLCGSSPDWGQKSNSPLMRLFCGVKDVVNFVDEVIVVDKDKDVDVDVDVDKDEDNDKDKDVDKVMPFSVSQVVLRAQPIDGGVELFLCTRRIPPISNTILTMA